MLVNRIEKSCIVSFYKAGEETAASPVPHPVEHEMFHASPVPHPVEHEMFRAGIVNTSPPLFPTTQNTSYLAGSLV